MYIFIYIYAFSRRFYPKWLTVHSGYIFILVRVLWELNPQLLHSLPPSHRNTGTFIPFCFFIFNLNPLVYRFNLHLCENPFLKLQSVNKQNCVRLAEEHCSRIYFSLFMSMTNHAGTGLLRSRPTWNILNINTY